MRGFFKKSLLTHHTIHYFKEFIVAVRSFEHTIEMLTAGIGDQIPDYSHSQ